jgi:acetyl-CoA carboxylase biotin carboxyl carrier protein
MDYMGEAKIDELEIEFPEGMKISMKKNTNKSTETSVTPLQFQPQAVTPIIQTNTENNLVEEKKICEENYKIIKSPMVGTFYESSSPGANAFVKVGDMVKKGQVVCIIEAMKLMNEIESEFEGEIVEVCVKDGEVIEYGMPLFKIK